jgi:hypothetical protein
MTVAVLQHGALTQAGNKKIKPFFMFINRGVLKISLLSDEVIFKLW